MDGSSVRNFGWSVITGLIGPVQWWLRDSSILCGVMTIKPAHSFVRNSMARRRNWTVKHLISWIFLLQTWWFIFTLFEFTCGSKQLHLCGQCGESCNFAAQPIIDGRAKYKEDTNKSLLPFHFIYIQETFFMWLNMLWVRWNLSRCYFCWQERGKSCNFAAQPIIDGRAKYKEGTNKSLLPFCFTYTGDVFHTSQCLCGFVGTQLIQCFCHQ